MVVVIESPLLEANGTDRWCVNGNMGFWSGFLLLSDWFSFTSTPRVFARTFDSIGTSFPSTWFVKTNVTCTNMKI